MVRTVDTDVVVIAIAKFQYFSLSELWIEFGVGKHLKYLPAHDISRSIGEGKSQALLAFHALTSQAVFKRRLLPTMAKRQHGKRGARSVG